MGQLDGPRRTNWNGKKRKNVKIPTEQVPSVQFELIHVTACWVLYHDSLVTNELNLREWKEQVHFFATFCFNSSHRMSQKNRNAKKWTYVGLTLTSSRSLTNLQYSSKLKLRSCWKITYRIPVCSSKSDFDWTGCVGGSEKSQYCE